MRYPFRPVLHLVRLLPVCIGLSLALGLVELSAQTNLDPKLAGPTGKAITFAGEVKPVADNGDKLQAKLAAAKDAALDAEGIAKLQEAAEVLKATPIGGEHGLDAELQKHLQEDPRDPAKNSELRKTIKSLADALAEADSRRKTEADALAAAETSRKARAEELAALEKADPKDEAKIAEKKKELATAEKAVADAKTALDAKVPGYDVARNAHTQLNGLLVRLKELHEGDKKLRTAANGYLTAAKRVAGSHQQRFLVTGFPTLLKERKDAGIHGALAVQLPAFGQAEALNPPMKKAAAPLQAGNDYSKGAAETLAAGLLPGGWKEETDTGNSYLKTVVTNSNECDQCVGNFERLWARMRDYAGEQNLKVGNRRDAIIKQIRDSLKDKRDPALDLGETHEALAPAKSLVADLRRADQDWPLLAAQLNTRYETPIEYANRAYKDARSQRDLLAQAVLLLEESFTGDVDHFVNEQVRLFYFDNVPRLMQTLNGATTILNPEGRVAVARGQNLQNKLLKSEQELFEKQGRVADLQRQVVVLEEKIRIQGQKVSAAAKTLSGLRSTESELKDKQVETATAKGKKDADVTRKEQTVTEARQKKDANEEGAAEALVKAEAALADAKKLAAEAKADDDAATERVKNQSKLVEAAEGAHTNQKNELDLLTGEKEGKAQNLAAVRSDLSELQTAVAGLRQSIVFQARIEAEAFGTARENTPIYFAPANFRSTDPIKRVMMYAFADSKTLFIRGLPEDVEKALDVIAGFDRPAPQARVTLWTMQLNSRDPNAINGRVRMINTELRHLRNNITTIQEVLRNSVNKEVNQVAQGMRNLTRGTALELDARLNRYFFYPPEIRERLGFKLPYRAWWSAATQVLRLHGDIQDIAHLTEAIAGLNYRIEKLKLEGKEGSKEIKGLRKDRQLLDEFASAAFDEARNQSLPRVELWLRELKSLEKCSTQIDTLVKQLQGATLSIRKVAQQVQDRLDEARGERLRLGKLSLKQEDRAYLQGYGPLPSDEENEPPVSPCGSSCQVLEEETRKAEGDATSRSPRLEQQQTVFQERLNTAVVHARKLDELTSFRDALGVVTEQVSAMLDGMRVAAFALAEERPESELQELPSAERKQFLEHQGNVRQLRLYLKDLEYVTRWTIPDPAHCTTLGETMFVLTLGRRSSRLRVLRDFSRELVNLSSRREINGDADNHDDQKAQEQRRKEYARFLDDSLQVLRTLITGQEGNGVTGSAGANGSRATAFPAMPKVLFGALNARTAGLNDDEMTANQLEVLLAIQAKARYSVASEIRGLLKQVDRSLAWKGRTNGKKVDVTRDGAGKHREDYLPLIGWLSRSHVDSAADFREIDARVKQPCDIPPSYRQLGAKTLLLELDSRGTLRMKGGDLAGRGVLIRADRMAWDLAGTEGNRNTLTQATARVAAADDMIKRLMIITEDDLDHYFVAPTLQGLQDAIHDKPGPGTRLGDRIAGLFGGTAPRVNLGLIQRTSILATNRLVARVSPNASADVELAGAQDFLQQAQQLGQLAQGVNNSFFAPDRVSRAAGAGVTAATTANAANLAGTTSLPVIGAAMGLLSLLQEQPKEPPGEVYSLNTGDVFKITPIFDPSGQALRFRFDHAATVRVREPDGTVNPSIPRVDRHTVNTEVQLSNLEVREVSRFGVNSQLGLPERRTGGIPFVRELPLLKDLPILGYFTRQASKAGVVQESVILGQTAIYPSVAELVDLLVDVPRRPEVGDEPPAFLMEPLEEKPEVKSPVPVEPAPAPQPPAKASACPRDLSGAAWLDGERFLVLHDTTKDGEARLSLVNEHTGQFTPLKIKGVEPAPYDLESIARIPPKPGEGPGKPRFLLVESGVNPRFRRVFTAELTGDGEARLYHEGDLPKTVRNIEGTAAFWMGDRLMLLFGERGESETQTVIHWGEIRSGTIISHDCKPYAAPSLKGPHRRHITALEIDSEGWIYAAGVSDLGDHGPFRSHVFRIGRLGRDAEGSTVVNIFETARPLGTLDGVKVESLAIREPGNGTRDLFIGTDDDGVAGILRRIASPPRD